VPRSFALLSVLLICSCAAHPDHPPRAAAAAVSPVPSADLARALAELGPYASFTLVMHPMAVPERGHLQCQWLEGKLAGFAFVETGAPGDQWWRLKLPPNTVGFGEPDESSVEEILHVTDGRVDTMTLPRLEGAGQAWHASFFCADGDLAAFSVGYSCGALCGRGFRVILRRSGTGWLLAYSSPTWTA
jgi:hypothetical protein